MPDIDSNDISVQKQIADVRVLVERVLTNQDNHGKNLSELQSKMPENLHDRITSLETKTASLSRWRTGLVSIWGAILTVLPFSDTLIKFYSNLKGGH